MELPRRPRGDELLAPGELTRQIQRLARLTPAHALRVVVASAFDHRTRMLPFIYADTRMAPAGVRAVGSALAAAGIDRVRIVLQQWNRRFDASRMRLDGQMPDLFCVSSMTMHGDCAMAMIRDAHRIEPDRRPLILAGGPRAIYQPHLYFTGDQPAPDVVCTGEEFVLLQLLEVLLTTRARGESLRSAFQRARRDGALDDVAGLVYPELDAAGRPQRLVHTGVQRLLGDLDELPDPVPGYRMLEPASWFRRALAPEPLPDRLVARRTPISSIVLTYGCKFACPYCPIPGYNQRQHRLKSGQRIAWELDRLQRTFGLRSYFGADDNFFNDPKRTMGIVDAIADSGLKHQGKPLRHRVRWHTEATVHDALAMRDQLPAIRNAGCRGLWLGVEDMSGALVRKGQDGDRTLEAFGLLRDAGICPHPMMMHHDEQPLVTRRGSAGLLNQVHALRRAGAASVQVLMICPSPGSKLYEATYAKGQVFARAAGRAVSWRMHDGNYVIASLARYPWAKQMNLWAAYASFYNPWNLLRTVRDLRGPLGWRPVGMQVVGMLGLTQNVRRTAGWAARLMVGPTRRAEVDPRPDLPMVTPLRLELPDAATRERVMRDLAEAVGVPMPAGG